MPPVDVPALRALLAKLKKAEDGDDSMARCFAEDDLKDALLLAAESLLDRVEELEKALTAILAEPYGCPMCDSGKLRREDGEHWHGCPYPQARALLARPEGGRAA